MMPHTSRYTALRTLVLSLEDPVIMTGLQAHLFQQNRTKMGRHGICMG